MIERKMEGERMRATVVFALGMLILVACERRPDPVEPPIETPIRGTVTRLDAEHRVVSIYHDEIKGVMEAMTMQFPVRDPVEFSKLRLGQEITGTVFQQPEISEMWIGRIRLVSPTEGITPSERPNPLSKEEQGESSTEKANRLQNR